MGDPAKLGKIGFQTISFYLVTTAIALMVGLGVGFLLEPGKAGVFNVEESFEAESPPPIMETLINIIPENPFEALTSGDMLQIIAFALFIGMADRKSVV